MAATGDATLERSLRHGKPHASIFIHGVFGHQFESEPTGREGYLAAMLVEGGIARVEVLGVHFIGGKPQAFTKPLIMDDLTFPQEFDWVADIRVVYQAQDVVIGGPGLLFCSQVFMKIRNHVAFALHISSRIRHAGSRSGVNTGCVVDKIGVEAAFLNFIFT